MSLRILVPIVATSLPLISNGPLLSFHLNRLSMKKGKNPIPLSSNLQDTVDQAFDDWAQSQGTSQEKLAKIKAAFKCFHCTAKDPIGIGASLLGKCLIGLPYHFSFKHVDQARLYMDHIGKVYDFEAKQSDIQNYLNSLVLSERAKKYAIAKEICYLTDMKVVPVNLLINAFLSSIYYFCYTFPMKDQKFAPLLLTIALLAGVLIIGEALAFVCSEDAGDKASDISEEYLVAAIEYYRSVIERNKASRRIEKDGETHYNTNGNYNKIISLTCLFHENLIDLEKKYAERRI